MLITWHYSRVTRTVVALDENGADGMVITDLPKKIPVLMLALHVLQRNRYTSRTRMGKIVHIGIAGKMPTKSAGGKEYEYIVLNDYSRAV